MNAAIWQAIKAILHGSPEWRRTCGMLHRGKPKRQMTSPHVIWYEIPGEDFDAFGSDVGSLLGQFTFVSGSADDAKIDAMVRATQTLLRTRKLTSGEMEVGWMAVNRTARVTMEDGTYDAQLDCEITFQGATQMPAFPGQG